MLNDPQFSVILPVCHGGRFLKAALDSLVEMDFPAEAFEVIIAADADDGEARNLCAAAAARGRAPLRFVPVGSANRSALLNAAWAEARGQWIVFSDDDCVFPSDWLRGYQNAVRRAPEAGMIGGVDELRKGGSAFDEALDWLLNSYVGTGGYRKPSGDRLDEYYPRLWNMAAPRNILAAEAVGAPDGRPRVFDESMNVHEDVDLAARIRKEGREIVFASEVRVEHCRDTTFFSFLRRNFRMARACRLKGVHRAAHLFLAGGMAGCLVLAALAMMLQPWRMVLAVAVGLYALILVGSGVTAAWSRRCIGSLFFVPALLAGVHAARGIGFLWPSREIKTRSSGCSTTTDISR
jgi:glycosyltransferase involved in cell wall biosynthesis